MKAGVARLAMAVLAPASPAVLHATTTELVWTRLPDLPEPIGLKGMYAGLSEGRVLLAGGSNFPRPLREGGAKTFHDRIFVSDLAAADDVPWTVRDERLPQALAEGASVTTDWGVVGLGGLDANGPTAQAFLLRWDALQRRVIWRDLPPLPHAAASAGAAVLDNRIYIAGGDDGRGDSNLFAVFDIEKWIQSPASTGWQPLPPWPGPARFGAVLQPVSFDGGSRLLLAGGKSAKQGYLADSYAFDADAGTWKQLPDMPRPALQAASLRLPNGTVAVLGGSDGLKVSAIAAGKHYRIPGGIMTYDLAVNRWVNAGEMPLGVVGAAVVATGSGWLLAGGEYSPGLRTSRVYRVEPSKPLRGRNE